jgi:hypothetical protein
MIDLPNPRTPSSNVRRQRTHDMLPARYAPNPIWIRSSLRPPSPEDAYLATLRQVASHGPIAGRDRLSAPCQQSWVLRPPPGLRRTLCSARPREPLLDLLQREYGRCPYRRRDYVTEDNLSPHWTPDRQPGAGRACRDSPPRAGVPEAFEPETAGLEGQYFVQAKLQARAPSRVDPP